MSDPKDFYKYATKHVGINSMVMDKYMSVANSYISPTIIEERQLNIASMDVFSRLMMDRIIFLGLPIDDYVANIIQAQLLYLDSTDPSKDISIYFNTPGGSVYAGLGIYDTMQYHLYRYGCFYGCGVVDGRCQRQAIGSASFKGNDSPAHGRCPGPVGRY